MKNQKNVTSATNGVDAGVIASPNVPPSKEQFTAMLKAQKEAKARIAEIKAEAKAKLEAAEKAAAASITENAGLVAEYNAYVTSETERIDGALADVEAQIAALQVKRTALRTERAELTGTSSDGRGRPAGSYKGVDGKFYTPNMAGYGIVARLNAATN